MTDISDELAAGTETPRRLYVYNGGFLTQGRVRRILALAGWDVRVGLPGDGDAVGVWGDSPTAPRGQAVAKVRGAPVVRVEDAFLRSLHPGRSGEPTFGLLIDPEGVHFDASQPSAVERLLAEHSLDDLALLARARHARAFMRRHHLSKYAASDPEVEVPEPGYVLVIDQTEGDAAVRASGATAETFSAMLDVARAEHPGVPVVIKSHPETRAGHRSGNFREGLIDPVSLTRLFEGAVAVYTVSSGLGLEAIFHGHRPVVFGTPVYAGWGLTDDRADVPRRGRALTVDQLFAATMILAPTWYDPVADALCEVEDVLRLLTAGARAWREDRQGWSASGMSRWKRPHLQRFFGGMKPVVFQPEAGRRRMVWASKTEAGAVRLEDGFLRSRGLGAALTPPLSYALDDLGIYYDPAHESRLERLIEEALALSSADLARARALIDRLIAARVTKYNTGSAPSALPEGHRVLVVGQVEDDAGLLAA
ncbi:MAG: capsular polysaccharide biosynthesis protein, partial [Pseudomonadota bacterium]